ncbi:MAG: nucleotidyltransferase domain-containing protein [archaeon]
MVRFYTYLEMFLDAVDKQVSLGDFERRFKTPHQTVRKHLERFVRAKVLREERRGRFLFYSLNRELPLTREYLVLCEKERLLSFLEKSQLFSRLYAALSGFFPGATIVLFGSAVTQNEFSDIDLLILSGSKELRKALTNFSMTYSVKIHPVQTTKEYLTPTFIKEVRKKHVIFNNHDKAMVVLYGY